MKSLPTCSRLLRWWSCLVVLGAATSCGPPGSPSTWQGEIEVTGDQTTVRTVSGSVWDEPLRLVEEFSIGLEDGPDHYVFGRLVGLAAHEGRILIINQRPIVVRAYAAAGTYLFDVGRWGSGPGEYLGPTALTVRPSDGAILLRDDALSMLNIYARDGGYLESWRLRTGYASFQPLVVTGDNRVFTVVRLPRRNAGAGMLLGMIKVSAQGAGSDTMMVPDYGRAPWIIEFDTPEGPLAMPVPFSPERIWAMSPTGEMLSSMSDRYRIEVRRPNGERLIIERVCDAIPFLAEEWQWYRDRVEAQIRVSAPGWRWRGHEIPSVKPYLAALASDRNGRTWVIRPGPGVRLESGNPSPETVQDYERAPLWGQSFLADIYDPVGRFLGEVNLPHGIQIRPAICIDGESIVAACQDETGFLTVRRYRIARTGTEDPGP